jgi:hypothetical protein
MSNTKKTINLIDQLYVDKKLEAIWSEYYTEDRNPISGVFQAEILKNAVTFLSLNPSLRPKDRQVATRGYYPEKPYPLIDWNAENSPNSFYKKFYNLGESINSWTAIELLYVRESSQKDLESKFASKSTIEKDKLFLINQMKLTFEILSELNPKIVVVSNALTDKLIHKYLLELNLKQELPTEKNGWIYRINGVPFITDQSRYLGSRFYVSNDEKRAKLVNEILRVLKISDN